MILQLSASANTVIVKFLGIAEYLPTWKEMREFTQQRNELSEDEIWIVEHPPVYTLGRAGKSYNLLIKNSIPLVKVDRGGDITFHGPGQMIAYTLVDIQRAKIGIRHFVRLLEESIINLLKQYNITAYRIAKRPGIYTDKGKIAALGLNCKKFGTYHGLSLNVSNDLKTYDAIRPCGIAQTVTKLSEFVNIQNLNVQTIAQQWLLEFQQLWQQQLNSNQ